MLVVHDAFTGGIRSRNGHSAALMLLADRQFLLIFDIAAKPQNLP
jgi:hypothetical protein